MNENLYGKDYKLLTSIWDDGIYLSTKVIGNCVSNTYYMDGYFLDIIYNTELGAIEKIILDESFNLSPDYLNLLIGYERNMN